MFNFLMNGKDYIDSKKLEELYILVRESNSSIKLFDYINEKKDMKEVYLHSYADENSQELINLITKYNLQTFIEIDCSFQTMGFDEEYYDASDEILEISLKKINHKGD